MRLIRGYSYSCLLARLPEPLASEVKGYGFSIPDDRIYDDDDGELGREDKPHVTVKYGLHTTDPDEVKKALEGQPPFQITLGPMSIFYNDEYVVIKLGVEGRGIHELNRFVSDTFKCTDTFPDYRPHCTVAYVKKDKFDPYWFNKYFTDRFEGKVANFKELIFSVPSGKKYTIELKGKPVERDMIKSAAKESLMLREDRKIMATELLSIAREVVAIGLESPSPYIIEKEELDEGIQRALSKAYRVMVPLRFGEMRVMPNGTHNGPQAIVLNTLSRDGVHTSVEAFKGSVGKYAPLPDYKSERYFEEPSLSSVVKWVLQEVKRGFIKTG